MLTQAIIAELSRHLPIDSRIIELGDIARPLGGALSRQELPATVEHELRAIESADLLIVAAPVYRGSYPGQFKHLFRPDRPGRADWYSRCCWPLPVAVIAMHWQIDHRRCRSASSTGHPAPGRVCLRSGLQQLPDQQRRTEHAHPGLAVDRAAPLFTANTADLRKTAEAQRASLPAFTGAGAALPYLRADSV